MSKPTSDGGPASGPIPVRDRRRANPSRLVRILLAVAVGQLPAAQRQRYAMEFLAELHDVSRPAQLRHVLGLVVHAWDLRLALHDSSPRIEEGPAVRKSIRCTLRVHHDVLRHNGEAQPPLRYFECTRCGRVVDPPSMAHVGFLG